MYNMTGGALSNKTINNMKKQGASSADINFATHTQHSTDANDVARHREYINRYNGGDPYRELNNWVMHPQSYQYGYGSRSPQQIGMMMGQLPGPVYINGPSFGVHPAMSPYVQFRSW